MATRITKSDVALLKDLGDFRMMALSQVTVLHFGSDRSARRRTQQLVEEGLVETYPVLTGTGAGRPESVFGITRSGYSLLDSRGALPEGATFEQFSGSPLSRQAGHQLLMNWCRIHVTHLAKVFPRLHVDFLSGNSPFALADESGGLLLRDCVHFDTEDGPTWFTPDAAIAITDTKRELTVPFFLEVDMGTETIAGSQASDIRQKIYRYQQYFRSHEYKRYEQVWSVSLDGFRLLFLTNSTSRMDSVSAIVRAVPPSDFVWVTSQDKMFAEGISGNIWARGGEPGLGFQSILGGLSRPVPIPGVIDK